jgi:hypothetical protein
MLVFSLVFPGILQLKENEDARQGEVQSGSASS